MYKSRVETFNQVRYFNRLIFVVYITRWWSEKQTAVLCLNAWTEVHKWEGKAEHYTGYVAMAAPQVAGPLSSCPTADGLSYDVHLKASICPNFPTGRPSGRGRKPCYRIIQRQREQTHCHWVIGMVKQLFDLHHGLNVWQKRCFALEWSRLNGVLKAWFATKGFASIDRQRLSIERTVFSVLSWNRVSFQGYTKRYQLFYFYCFLEMWKKYVVCPMLT